MPNLSSLIKSIRDIMREDRGLSGDGQRIEQLAWMLFLKIMDDSGYPRQHGQRIEQLALGRRRGPRQLPEDARTGVARVGLYLNHGF